MRARLERSNSNRVIGGVCGGLAQYLALDAWIVRIFFVLLALGDGIGIFLYLLLWIIMPRADQPEAAMGQRIGQGAAEVGQQVGEMAAEVRYIAGGSRQSTLQWIGITLMLLGGYYLLRNLDLVWFRWLNWGVMWPVLLIAAGVVVLLRRGAIDEQ